MAPPTGPKPNGAARNTSSLDSLLPDEADLIYEEELLRNPYSLRMWIRYLDARKNAPPLKRRLLYERALEKLPGSYKVGDREIWGSMEFAGSVQLGDIVLTSVGPLSLIRSSGTHTCKSAGRKFATVVPPTPGSKP